ncbi:MAG: hypothetical protein A2928_00480 [Candidatus Taylorbacteria bacterium RIFCSPLOWO2_01_FULL_45_15b]|uniref:Glucose/Sorbosone dehydrogenase domain-containing protein n=1 Tax=Candidatus Taylorbacteria bacterium RIFCSPLOWO2_01_FULL_45_15b TaxID=1802319 RepID=A0A1G2N7S2_9BACT|nr:MAG: hypothetical protein A2928_00480 [Candidatus Taylorbacteria bacterium RIFCSPLOWO2_01_FULL_45_15b]
MNRYKTFHWIALFVFIAATVFILKKGAEEENSENTEITNNGEEQSVIAQNLSVPWEVLTLPDGTFLVSERVGTIARIRGEVITRTRVDAGAAGEGGLLGLALHPRFEQNNFLYVYVTRQQGGGFSNAILRFVYDPKGNVLRAEKVILENIPGATYHDGGRLAFGPDRYLYITTGDAGVERSGQDKNSLAGKILRVDENGGIPADNPFGTAVWSYGHRNPQGLAWDHAGNLWSTEHGRSGVLSGYDELNLIVKGGNYGWPDIQGSESRHGMIAPVIHSGASDTWAPASLSHREGKLYWGGLRGEAVYEVVIEGERAEGPTEYFKRLYGRIRSVIAVPGENYFLISTSNIDGRGAVREGDDKLLKIPFLD